MPSTITDPFGNSFEVCSISTAVKAKFKKEAFQSESQWSKQVKADAYDVLRVKINNGEVVKNTVVGRTPLGHKLVYKGEINGEHVMELSKTGVQSTALKSVEDYDHTLSFLNNDWDFGPNMVKMAKAQKAVVDSPAKLEKWLKSADGMDVDLGDVLAEVTSDFSDKVNLLKFDGMEGGQPKYLMNGVAWTQDGLDALAKSSFKIKYKVGQVPPDLPVAHGLPVPSTSASTGALTNEDAATYFVKTKDKLAKEAGLNVKGSSGKLDDLVYKTIADQTGYTPAEIKAKVDAYKATGKKLSSLKKKVMKGSGNPKQEVVAKAVDKAAEAVKKETPKPEDVPQVWDSEAVAKAYVKAKDHVVAVNDKGWTLYTKSDEFDKEILKWMQADLGPIKKETADTAIADYIANHKKLSVLKKQMIKNGELKLEADTLKGGKKAVGEPDVVVKPAPEETGAGQTGKATEDPTKVGPKQEAKLTDEVKAQIEDQWESSNLPLSSSGEKIYNTAKIIAKQYGLGDDILPVLRWVDEYKAQKFGVPNGHLYEKKVLQHLANPNPAGYVPPTSSAFTGGHIEQGAIDTFGELPEDSTLFREIGPSEMDTLARTSMGRPTSEQISNLRAYSGSYYHDINTALRSGGQLAHHGRGQSIQAAMEPLPDHLIVKRGTSLRGIGLNSYDELPGAVGKTFVEPGFSSTAVGGSGQFSGEVNLIIQAPKGTQAVWLKPYSNYAHENELLLAAGTRFRILKVEVKSEGYGKRTFVTVRVEP